MPPRLRSFFRDHLVIYMESNGGIEPIYTTLSLARVLLSGRS